jgi:hypothetical protein
MNLWYGVFGVAAVLAGTAALYGLHRLCLWLEERGQLYYLHKKPEGGSSLSAFVALQHEIEPQSRQVIQVTEQKRNRSEKEAPGDGTGRQEQPPP